MNIREHFEEIWPVPEGVSWYEEAGEYVPDVYNGEDDFFYLSCEWDARLDTFTRCQETTDVYVSLVEEMVAELEHVALHAYGCVPLQTQDLIDHASQLKEQKK